MTDIGHGALERLESAARQVVEFVTANGLDGVDLDLECWWDKNGDPDKDEGERNPGDPHPAGLGLTAFAKKLRELLPEKIVSAAVFGTSYYGNNYDERIIDYLDWLSIMTYDFTGSWRESPVGPHTALRKIHTVAGMSPNQTDYVSQQHGKWPLPRKRLQEGNASQDVSERIRNNPIFSIEDSVAFWTNPNYSNYIGRGKKVPVSKICIGVATFGYDFAYREKTRVTPGYGIKRYKDLFALDPTANTKEPPHLLIDGSAPTPDFVAEKGSDTYGYSHNIWYETPGTATAKAQFARSIGAQGIIIWEVSSDVWEEGKSIVQELYSNSGNGIKPPLGVSAPVLGPLGMQFLLLTDQDKNLGPITTSEINTEKMKEDVMRAVLKPAAFLAHLLGYGWCGGCKDGKGGYIGDNFAKIPGEDGFEAIYTEGCEGYMAEKRLKIRFLNWSLAVKQFTVGNLSSINEVVVSTAKTSVDNTSGDVPLEQRVGGSREVQTQVSTYNLQVKKWEVGGEVGIKGKTPLSFLGGIEVEVKLHALGGGETQTGEVVTTSDKRTVSNTVKVEVPAHTRKDFQIDMLGANARSDNCQMKVEVKFML